MKSVDREIRSMIMRELHRRKNNTDAIKARLLDFLEKNKIEALIHPQNGCSCSSGNGFFNCGNLTYLFVCETARCCDGNTCTLSCNERGNYRRDTACFLKH